MSEYQFLTEAIKKEMTYYSIPGCAIVVIDHGKSSSFQFGYSDVENKKEFTVDTISGIGSCSKSMTAFAAMRLAEKNILDLDAPVVSYVPSFALWNEEASKHVTIRDMLCHRTGLGGHDGTWPDNDITRVEFLARLKYMEPNEPFRKLAQYSNVMYIAVGGIMEAVTGKKWENIMAEEIFQPLGMNKTFCLMEEAVQHGNCAVPYWWNNGLHAVSRWNIDMAGPCGSVMSSAQDMAKWLMLHIGKGKKENLKLISEANFLDMHTAQIIMDYPHIKGGNSLGYGLGWRVMDYHGHIVQQHTGKIEGYSAFQFYLPEEECGAVFLQNIHAPDNPFIFTIQGLLLDHFLKRLPVDWLNIYTEKMEHAPEAMYHNLEFNCMPPVPMKVTKQSHELSAYIGTYKNKGYGIFTISLEKDRLWLHERAVLYRPMQHFSGDTFEVQQVKEDTDLYSLPLTFMLSYDKSQVVGFKLLMEPKVQAVEFEKIHGK